MIKTLLRGLIVAIVGAAIFFAAKELQLFEKASELLSKITSKPASSEAAATKPPEEGKPEQTAVTAVPGKPAKPSTASTAQPAKQTPKTTASARISLPPPLTGISFRIAPEALTARLRCERLRETPGELVLVHYLDPTKRREARFYFQRGSGLSKIELMAKPDRLANLNQLYESILAECQKRYSNVPHSKDTAWDDGAVAAYIMRQPDKVLLTFTLSK